MPLSAGGSIVARGAAAEFAGWLRWLALTQYSWLLLSVLDGLRVVGSRIGARRARNLQSPGNSRGTARPLGRHAGDWLRRHLRDVVDMAGMSNVHE